MRGSIRTTILMFLLFVCGMHQLAWAPAAERRIAPGTVKGNLAVEGDTALGDAVGDAVTGNAGSWTWPNVTTFNFDAAFTFDATGFSPLFKGTTYDFTQCTNVTVPDANAATEAMNQQTSDARYLFGAGGTITGNLAVDGNTILGDAVGDAVTINAGTVTHPNATTIDFDAATTINVDGPTIIDSRGKTLLMKAGALDYEVTTFNFDSAPTFDATGFSPLFKGTTYDFTQCTNVTVPDANAATEAMNQQTSDARYLFRAGDTVAGNLAVDGHTILGDADADTVTVNASTVTYTATTSFHFDGAVNVFDSVGTGIYCEGDLWDFTDVTEVKSKVLELSVGNKGAPPLHGPDLKTGLFFGAGGTTVKVTVNDSEVFTCEAGGVGVVGDAKVSGDLTDGSKSLSVAEAEAAFVHSGVTSGNPHSVSKSDVGLGNVENTALSTWTGSANVDTLGTVTTGTWNATDVPISAGGTGESTALAGFDALAPTGTKGDLVAYSTINVAVGVGTNDQVLTADGTKAAGVKWADPALHAAEHEVGGGDLITHDNLTGAGTKSHGDIDTHLGSTSNPHSVTAAQASAVPTSEKGAANGVATLSAGSLVVENPANASATPGAATIPISDGSGLLDGWVTSAPTIKSGTVAGGSFAGNPKVFTVTFNTAFPDTNYAVTIEGEDNRTFTYQTKLAGSFVMNTNANLVIAGNVDWTATAHNDP